MDLNEFNQLRAALTGDMELIAERGARKALNALEPRVDTLERQQRRIKQQFAKVAVVFGCIGAAVSAVMTYGWNRITGQQ